jgi:hypothetical protein
MPGRPVLAFDVSPDRSWGAIAGAGVRKDGVCHVEIVDHRRGADWIAERLSELVGRHRQLAVVTDARGPASSILPALERLRPPVTIVNALELSQACAQLLDDVHAVQLAHLGDPDPEAAVAGAVKRPLGDAWAFSRRNSFVDICPLVSVTLALWGARTLVRPAQYVWGSQALLGPPDESEVQQLEAEVAAAKDERERQRSELLSRWEDVL